MITALAAGAFALAMYYLGRRVGASRMQERAAAYLDAEANAALVPGSGYDAVRAAVCRVLWRDVLELSPRDV